MNDMNWQVTDDINREDLKIPVLLRKKVDKQYEYLLIDTIGDFVQPSQWDEFVELPYAPIHEEKYFFFEVKYEDDIELTNDDAIPDGIVKGTSFYNAALAYAEEKRYQDNCPQLWGCGLEVIIKNAKGESKKYNLQAESDISYCAEEIE